MGLVGIGLEDSSVDAPAIQRINFPPGTAGVNLTEWFCFLAQYGKANRAGFVSLEESGTYFVPGSCAPEDPGSLVHFHSGFYTDASTLEIIDGYLPVAYEDLEDVAAMAIRAV